MSIFAPIVERPLMSNRGFPLIMERGCVRYVESFLWMMMYMKVTHMKGALGFVTNVVHC